MLVLSRFTGESVHLTDQAGRFVCTVVVVSVSGGKVRLGFDAPPTVRIARDNAGGRDPLSQNKEGEHGSV